jgi:hypothetical protein
MDRQGQHHQHQTHDAHAALMLGGIGTPRGIQHEQHGAGKEQQIRREREGKVCRTRELEQHGLTPSAE